MTVYKDAWLPVSVVFLEAEGLDCEQVIQGARLGLMLTEHGETAIIGVEVSDNRVAWCRTYANGWGCVAIAPRGDKFTASSVPRDVFFASRWPKSWKTPRDARKVLKRAADLPFVQNGMAWANDPAGGICVARIEHVEPLTLLLAPDGALTLASDSGLNWRPFSYNAEGLEMEWRAGRVTFNNFRFAAMRAGLRVKHMKNAKPKKQPETEEGRKARIAKWAAACAEGRARAKAKRDAALEAARETARQNVQKGD